MADNGNGERYAGLKTVAATLGIVVAVGTIIWSTDSAHQENIRVLAERVSAVEKRLDSGIRPESNLEKLRSIHETLKDHMAIHGHPGISTDVAKLSEHFAEVETQFREQRSIMDLKIDKVAAMLEGGRVVNDERIDELHRQMTDFEARYANMKAMNAAQSERLRALEREVMQDHTEGFEGSSYSTKPPNWHARILEVQP